MSSDTLREAAARLRARPGLWSFTALLAAEVVVMGWVTHGWRFAVWGVACYCIGAVMGGMTAAVVLGRPGDGGKR